MSEKTPFWKLPQNYIIAILLLGITGYIGYQQLQPKTNKLAQASAYFDSIDAEERAEAEKKRAAEEKEKARLAAIEMEKAKEEARLAKQKAKEVEDKARQERASQAAREALAYMRSSNSASNQDTKSDESPSYEYKATYSCSFCCAGQFGNCRSSRITVQTTTAELWEAQQFIRNSYAEQCAQFPFYSGGGGSASVDNFNCDLK